ncbi:MAG: hypothetical protein FWG11_08320, partial [Promicromonosporaceae bacterium]|nr:hypothetical protein [Promicromonosporaceae bacterium]
QTVAAGPTREVLRPAVLDPVYGVRTTVLTDPELDRPVLTFSRPARIDPPAPSDGPGGIAP